MTDAEAYERACATWVDGVALRLGARCIVGRWVPIGELGETPGARVMLRTPRQGCEAMGEGESWEAAFVDAERRARMLDGAGGAIEP